MRTALFIALAAAAAAPLSAATPQEPQGEAALQALIAGRVAGTPVSCLSLHTLRESRVIDGTAIVYRTAGSRFYVNRPRSGADALNAHDILVTRTPSSELCSVDPVDMVDRFSRAPTGFVTLGDFVPYDRPAAK